MGKKAICLTISPTIGDENNIYSNNNIAPYLICSMRDREMLNIKYQQIVDHQEDYLVVSQEAAIPRHHMYGNYSELKFAL